MEKTIGKQLLNLRRKSGLTQDALAEKLGVSPQAVSKWENDIACPDIMLLPKIAQLYGITVDDLFSEDEAEVVNTFEKEPVCETQAKYLIVYVDSVRDDNVKVTLPVSVVKSVCNAGMGITKQFGVDLSGIDFDVILASIEEGATGEIVNVISQNGDKVRVVIE